MSVQRKGIKRACLMLRIGSLLRVIKSGSSTVNGAGHWCRVQARCYPQIAINFSIHRLYSEVLKSPQTLCRRKAANSNHRPGSAARFGFHFATPRHTHSPTHTAKSITAVETFAHKQELPWIAFHGANYRLHCTRFQSLVPQQTLHVSRNRYLFRNVSLFDYAFTRELLATILLAWFEKNQALTVIKGQL
jgi:hypothetical protein